MMHDRHSLSVVVPVYNEGRLLASSVARVIEFLQHHVREFEVLIIESGSTDGSRKLCDALSADDPRIRVIHEDSRNGYGAAVKLGFQHARMDLLLVLTLDLPYPLETIDAALDRIADYDCVLSYRKDDPRRGFRRIQSVVYNVTVKALLGLRMRHVNSAFKLLKRSFVESLILVSNGWFIDAEILYWISRRGMSYVEIPVSLVARTVGASSVSYLAFIGIVKELARFLRSRE